MNEKDIGAGRYAEEDEVTKTKKRLKQIDDVYNKDLFTMSVTLRKEDIKIKKYESGLYKVTLKNVHPNTICPQIPHEILGHFYQTEKVRHDLRGDKAREVLTNIEKRKEKWIKEMSTKSNGADNEVKKQRNLFDKNINKKRSPKIEKEQINVVQKEKKSTTIVLKSEQKSKPKNSLGGLFDFQKPKKEVNNNGTVRNNNKSNPIRINNTSNINSNNNGDRNGNLRNNTHADRFLNKTDEKIKKEFTHVKQKSAVKERKKNKISFSEETLNMY